MTILFEFTGSPYFSVCRDTIMRAGTAATGLTFRRKRDTIQKETAERQKPLPTEICAYDHMLDRNVLRGTRKHRRKESPRAFSGAQTWSAVCEADHVITAKQTLSHVFV